MYWSVTLSYWVTLLLALPAAGLLVRTFIIMHDCAHGSFLPSKRANTFIGWITGVLTLTPYLKLPAVLHWFTGSIGVHHVHHLGPRIPNYALKRCHEENPLFHDVTTLTLPQSIRTLRLTLWDETRHQLVGFRDAMVARPAKAA
jgi:fatty acid desaturase